MLCSEVTGRHRSHTPTAIISLDMFEIGWVLAVTCHILLVGQPFVQGVAIDDVGPGFLIPGPNAPATNTNQNIRLVNETSSPNLKLYKLFDRPIGKPHKFKRKNRAKRDTSGCCKKVVVKSDGRAARIQWDRMGVFKATGERVQGHLAYLSQDKTQSLFYLYGDFDGWMIGPEPGKNFGGIKSSHDEMCVHSANNRQMGTSSGWSFYAGPTDTKDPHEAVDFWSQDDSSLAVSCVPRSVNIDSRRVSNDARAPMLLETYKHVRHLLVAECGAQLSRRLNIDVWAINIQCTGGPCLNTTMTIQMVQGMADLLMVVSDQHLDLTRLCFECHDHSAARLETHQTTSMSSMIFGSRTNLYIIITGYSDYYVSLNVKISSANIFRATPVYYQN